MTHEHHPPDEPSEPPPPLQHPHHPTTEKITPPPIDRRIVPDRSPGEKHRGGPLPNEKK